MLSNFGTGFREIDAKYRTNIFFLIHAAGVASAIISPSLSSFMMGYNVWLPWILGLTCILGSACVSLAVPNTAKQEILTEASSTSPGINGDVQGSNKNFKARLTTARRAVQHATNLIFANGQVLLLLAILLIGQLGLDSLLNIMLLYISKRYDWTFAEVWPLFFSIPN